VHAHASYAPIGLLSHGQPVTACVVHRVWSAADKTWLRTGCNSERVTTQHSTLLAI
jgi:hypothetical protein